MAKDEFKQDWDEFDSKFTDTVRKTLTLKGWGPTQLAKELGMTQPALSALLRVHGPREKHWTVPTMLRLAKLFNTTFYQLVYETENPSSYPMFLIVKDTGAFTLERLQLLIYAAVGYSDQAPAGGYDDVIKMFYQVSTVVREAPDFCSHYQAGKISDTQALTILQDASSLLYIEKYKGKISYGMAVSEAYVEFLLSPY